MLRQKYLLWNIGSVPLHLQKRGKKYKIVNMLGIMNTPVPHNEIQATAVNEE